MREAWRGARVSSLLGLSESSPWIHMTLVAEKLGIRRLVLSAISWITLVLFAVLPCCVN